MSLSIFTTLAQANASHIFLSHKSRQVAEDSAAASFAWNLGTARSAWLVCRTESVLIHQQSASEFNHPFGLIEPTTAAYLAGLAGGIIAAGIVNFIDAYNGESTLCEAGLSTICAGIGGCLVGALGPYLALTPGWAAFFACEGIGAIIGALTTACNALAQLICSFFDCVLASLSWDCFIAGVVTSALGCGLGCAIPVEGSENLV